QGRRRSGARGVHRREGTRWPLDGPEDHRRRDVIPNRVDRLSSLPGGGLGGVGGAPAPAPPSLPDRRPRRGRQGAGASPGDSSATLRPEDYLPRVSLSTPVPLPPFPFGGNGIGLHSLWVKILSRRLESEPGTHAQGGPSCQRRVIGVAEIVGVVPLRC